MAAFQPASTSAGVAQLKEEARSARRYGYTRLAGILDWAAEALAEKEAELDRLRFARLARGK